MLLVLPKGLPTFPKTAGNWTRPDKVWQCNTPDDPITCCDMVLAIHPTMADPLPIVTKLALPLLRGPKAKSLDIRKADWPTVNADLAQWLEVNSSAASSSLKGNF